MTSSVGGNVGPVAQALRAKLTDAFSPSYLEVINESGNHNVPRGSESHFKVIVVSDIFDGKSIIDRHRLVNDCLKEELSTRVHALSIVPKTPSQWYVLWSFCVSERPPTGSSCN